MLICFSPITWGIALIIPGIDITPLTQQKKDNILVAEPGCQMQRGLSILLFQGRICPSLQPTLIFITVVDRF